MDEEKPAKIDLMAEFATVTETMRNGFAFLDSSMEDTELVLLATSMIDKLLQFCLLLKFRSTPSRVEFETVFEGYGPLATFSSKIAVASVLGVIADEMKHDLKILRKVRNAFAHSTKRIRLQDFPQCRSLKQKPDAPLDWPQLEKRRFAESSQVMIGRLSIMSIATLAETSVINEQRDRIKSRAIELVAWFYDGAKDPKPSWLA